MLSDAEQSRLTQIESYLRNTDPLFVDRFDDRWRQARRWRFLAMFALPITVLIIVLGVAMGSVVASVIGLTATGVVFGVWLYLLTASEPDCGTTRAWSGRHRPTGSDR